MRPLSAADLRGTWGTVLLPINADDSISWDQLEHELEVLVSAGLDGIYTNGTAGEFYAQSEDEFDRLSLLVAERCERAGVAFQIGVSHPSAQTQRERLRRAVELRPGAVQVILPDWNATTLDEATAFLGGIAAEAGDAGLVLYNPPHARHRLDARALAHLKAAVPALIGVKVMDGGPSWYAAIRRHLAEVAVFVPGHHLATGALQGARGSYSNVACLSPRGAKRWNDLIASGSPSALDIERRILDFFEVHIVPLAAQGYGNPALDKCLAAIGGWAAIGTRLRWPYRGVQQDVVERLQPIARTLVPELFVDD